MTILKLFLFTIATFSSAFSMDPHEKIMLPLRIQKNIQPKDLATDDTLTAVWYTFELYKLPKAYADVEKNSCFNPEQTKRMQKIAQNVIQKRLQPVMNYVNEKICVYDLLIHNHDNKKNDYLTIRKQFHDFKSSFMGFLTPEQVTFDDTNLSQAIIDMIQRIPDAQLNLQLYLNILIDLRNAPFFNGPKECTFNNKNKNLPNDWSYIITLDYPSLKS